MKRLRAEKVVQAEKLRKPEANVHRERRSDCKWLRASVRARTDAREDGAKGDEDVEHEARITTGRAWFMAYQSYTATTQNCETRDPRQILKKQRHKYHVVGDKMDHDELRSSAVLGPHGSGVMVVFAWDEC